MAWILTIDVPSAEADAVSDQLWTLGTNGVAEVPSGDDARLLAGFETEAEAKIARGAIGGSIAPIDPPQWAPPEAATIEVGGRTLTIDAGHSFGHGGHPTTRLCLQALERHVGGGDTVLDVGCGSGVLSLAASTLGASAVTAIDIDPEAITATTENARANNLTLNISATPLADVSGSFDIVVVNMLIAEVEPLAGDLRRVAGGLVILSGALIEQADRWSAMFPGSEMMEATTDGEWAGKVIRTHE